MIIEHNGKVVCHTEPLSIRDAINKINENVEAVYRLGRVVNEIIIDGYDVTGTVESYIESKKGQVQKVIIYSVDRNEMFLELHVNTVEYLAKVLSAIDSISDLFYGETEEEVWTYFAQLIEGLGYVVQLLQVMADHLAQTDRISGLSVEIEDSIRKIGTHISDINQAITDHDTVQIADILKYELSEIVANISEILTSKVKR